MKDITDILNRHMHSVSQQKKNTQKLRRLLNKFVYIYAENKVKRFVLIRFVSVEQADIKHNLFLRNECLNH